MRANDLMGDKRPARAQIGRQRIERGAPRLMLGAVHDDQRRIGRQHDLAIGVGPWPALAPVIAVDLDLDPLPERALDGGAAEPGWLAADLDHTRAWRLRLPCRRAAEDGEAPHQLGQIEAQPASIARAVEDARRGPRDDGAYRALRETRAAALAWFAATIVDLRPVVFARLPRSLPAYVVAWRLYGDLDRLDDLAGRNQLKHPGYMPETVEAIAP